MRHFDLRLGRQTVAVAEGVRIANPMGFTQDEPLAMVERLTVTLDTMELLRHRAVVVPDILVAQPRIVATQLEDGSANYLISPYFSDRKRREIRPSSATCVSRAAMRMLCWRGCLLTLTLPSRRMMPLTPHEVVADAKGAYAGQPIDARFVGGALLSLRDAVTPYQVNLKSSEWSDTCHARRQRARPTEIHAGTDLKLEMAGTNIGIAVAADRHRLSEDSFRHADQRRCGLCRGQDPFPQLCRTARLERH